MTGNAFLEYVRRYAAIALRFRHSFADTLRPFAVARYKALSAGVTDPVELERLREKVAGEIVRNYSTSDPNGEPFADTVLAWLRSE